MHSTCFALVSDRKRLAGLLAGQQAILTPHPAEAGRLLGCSTEQVQQDRVGSACELAAALSCVIVLKGSGTVVADPQGKWAIVAAGNPSLAAAGSGDLLAGIIAALRAQGLAAWGRGRQWRLAATRLPPMPRSPSRAAGTGCGWRASASCPAACLPRPPPAARRVALRSKLGGSPFRHASQSGVLGRSPRAAGPDPGRGDFPAARIRPVRRPARSTPASRSRTSIRRLRSAVFLPAAGSPHQAAGACGDAFSARDPDKAP